MANRPPTGQIVWPSEARQRDRLKLTLLGSALFHAVVAGFLSIYATEETIKNEPITPVLSVVLPSGSASNGEAPFFPQGQRLREPQQAFTRNYSRQTDVISRSGRAEQIDTSLYAPPENIDDVASVIEAPELPLPPDREIASGLLRIRVFVNEEGNVDQIELTESNLQENYSSRLIQAFKESKFSPGILHGKPIKSWRMIEINYIDP